MAEVLGVLGATAASTQLAVQAGKSFIYLREIVVKMKAAPEDVLKYTAHIEQLIAIAELFKISPKLHATISPILETCCAEAKKLGDLMQGLAVSPTEKWYRKTRKKLRVVLKEKDINQMFMRLEREKTSLIVAIAQVDSKLLQSIGLDVAYTKSKTDEVLVVVKDNAHQTTRVVSKLTDITAKLEDIQLHVNAPILETAPTSRATPCLIPRRPVRDFIGREDILTKIAEGFARPTARGQPKIVTISGLGGQGKTQLALEYCRRVQETGIETILWVDSMSEEQVIVSFKKIAGLIADARIIPGDGQIIDFVLEKLTAWPKSWLLVFDNHDDPSAFHLQDYFPRAEQGCIIVTSRNAGVVRLDRKNAVILEGLSEPDALNLLFGQCGSERTDSNDEIGKTIVRRMGYHTLAIAQAGSYILLRQLDLDEFLRTFETRKEGILKHTPEMPEYQRQLSPMAKETALNVFTTWELSFELLKHSNRRGEHKEDILTLFAFFDSKDISEELFRIYYKDSQPSPTSESTGKREIAIMFGMTNVWCHEKFESILTDLTQMTLIQPWNRDEEENCHFSLHPLIRDWIRLRTNLKSFQRCSANAAHILVDSLAIFEDDTNHVISLSMRLALLSHIDIYIQNYNYLKINSAPEEWTQNYANFHHFEGWFCDYLNQNGRLSDAEVMAERVTSWSKAKYGTKSREFLVALSDQAYIAKTMGDYVQAQSLYRYLALENSNLLGPENVQTLRSLQNLAQVLEFQGNLVEAESIFRRVLASHLVHNGEEHSETLVCLNNLAVNLNAQGKHKEAEAMHRHVLQIRERTLGHEHPESLISSNSLGNVLFVVGRHKEAEAISRRVLKIRESTLGLEHPATIRSCWNLACVLQSQGQNQEVEALGYFERAASLSLKVLGPDHPDTKARMEQYSSYK